MFTGTSNLISQGLFIKSIGLIYLIAFLSLKVQVLGLYGSKGIQPIEEYLRLIKLRYNQTDIYYKIPTIFWLNASDRSLNLACWAGVSFSVLAVLGVYPAICLFILWILYQSFCSAGAPFLNYQWDILLLEVGFIAILFAIQSPPPLLLVYLLWFVLFRLIFSSGLTKLIHGSEEWHQLTAIDFHYETQPLPTKLGYYAHQLPKIFAKISVIGVYFFELFVPVFIFSPPLIRLTAFSFLVLFQLLIILTGNYAFFNILTVFMCLPLLPDSYLQGFTNISSFTPLVENYSIITLILNTFAAFFMLLNTIELLTIFTRVGKIYRLVIPFRLYNLINPYGLFVRMTTWRDEIIVEGSKDGKNWKTYEFKWKPGNLFNAPRRIAPHQPRLDWQMWFAALGDIERNPWFKQFLYRLLEGSTDVIKLLKINPFPEKPPHYIRTKIYRYHFTDLKKKKETGAWWSREYIAEYSPTLTLSED